MYDLESPWQWLYVRAVQLLVVVFAALVAVGILFYAVEALGVEARAVTFPPHVECFLDNRVDGQYWSRTARRRAWVHTFLAHVERALQGRDFPAAPIVLGVSYHESRWKPRVQGPIGEHGLMQIHPDRARAMLGPGEDPLDPDVNLRMGVDTLASCRETCGEDLARVLQCYAAGDCARPGPAARELLRYVTAAQECSTR